MTGRMKSVASEKSLHVIFMHGAILAEVGVKITVEDYGLVSRLNIKELVKRA